MPLLPRAREREYMESLCFLLFVVVLVAQSCLTLLRPHGLAHQTSLFMGFSWQEYWSELPFPSPGNLPYPGIKPTSPALQVDSLLLNHVWSLLLSVTRGKVLPFNKGSFPPKGRVWMFSQEKSTHPLQSTHLSSINIYLSSRTYPSFKKVKFHPNLMQISITWPKL